MASIVFWHRPDGLERTQSKYKNGQPEIIIHHSTPITASPNSYEYILTRKRALIFGCIGLITAALVITMALIPYQYTHINISSETKKQKGICEEESANSHKNGDWLIDVQNKSNSFVNDSVSSNKQNASSLFAYNASSTPSAKNCNTWSAGKIVSSEIWFGVIFGLSAFATIFAGFRQTKANTIFCLIFSMVSVLTSLILLFYSIIWHSISMVISIVQGLVSFICLVMTSKDICHNQRRRNVVVQSETIALNKKSSSSSA